ncbi:MAG: hypothetical protein KF788_17485 [Piscinibacter sp.]|nr:hypothetical protein [Piscinibacter sp.]
MTRLTTALAALTAAALLSACGGGQNDTTLAALIPAPDAMDVAPASVPLEGCIAGADGRTLAVHATGMDGRLLGTALTDPTTGVFRMEVPARQTVRLDTGTNATGGLAVLTGSHPLTIGACLHAA